MVFAIACVVGIGISFFRSNRKNRKMSLLKKSLQKICLHLQDYQDTAILIRLIPVRELRRLIQDYLLNELEFENELYALCYHFYHLPETTFSTRAMMNRISRFFDNYTDAAVRNWWRTYCFHNPCIGNYNTPYYAFIKTFYFLDSGVCNRLWCWYRLPINDHCLCGHPLPLDIIQKLAKDLY